MLSANKLYGKLFYKLYGIAFEKIAHKWSKFSRFYGALNIVLVPDCHAFLKIKIE